MNILISPSTLNEAQFCWRSFHFKKNLGYTLTGERRSAGMGLFLHKLLEMYYRTRFLEGKSWSESVVNAIEMGRVNAVDGSIAMEDAEHVIRIFDRYCSHYKNESWNIIEVEKEFATILYENKDEDLKIAVKGKMDMIIEIQGMQIPVDHKGIIRDYKQFSRMDNQLLCYLIPTNSWNIIINKVGLQKDKTDNERFQRKTISYSKNYIEGWKKGIIKWCKEIIKRGIDDANGLNPLEIWEPNFTSCDKWQGCMYKNVCDLEPEGWEEKFNQDYIKIERGDD